MKRPTTRCVPPKTDEQLDLQALHRVRYRLVGQRTAIINQIRCFLLEHCDRERALSAIRLGDVDPPARQCPIRSPLDPCVQVLEIALKVCLVVLPRQPIHARCSIRPKFEERLFEQIDIDVVEERGELLLLPFSRDFPYAFQRL
jgi:hypothetical protein